MTHKYKLHSKTLCQLIKEVLWLKKNTRQDWQSLRITLRECRSTILRKTKHSHLESINTQIGPCRNCKNSMQSKNLSMMKMIILVLEMLFKLHYLVQMLLNWNQPPLPLIGEIMELLLKSESKVKDVEPAIHFQVLVL